MDLSQEWGFTSGKVQGPGELSHARFSPADGDGGKKSATKAVVIED